LIRDRRDLAQLLTERMTRTYELLREQGELETDTSLLKSYVIEANLSTGADVADALGLATRVFGEAQGQNLAVDIERSDDPSLAVAHVHRRGTQFDMYLDYADSRFWIIHSMGGSGDVDWVIDRMTAGVDFDRAWLPADLLEGLTDLGSFRGLGLSYDKRPFAVDEPEGEEADEVTFLKMQLWGNRSAAVLNVLRAEGAFPNQTTLSKVRVRYDLDHAQFTLDDIKYDGKITARGSSFSSHVALMERVIDPYAGAIVALERDYPIRPSREGQAFEGEALFFEFEPPIENLERFCALLFSGGQPFRLWGAPMRVRGGSYRVVAVDLHVARPITFEINARFMRVYMSENSCGNSVLRLYTNLQHHYTALVLANRGSGEPVFDFQ
jgi:hypothetical protein